MLGWFRMQSVTFCTLNPAALQSVPVLLVQILASLAFHQTYSVDPFRETRLEGTSKQTVYLEDLKTNMRRQMERPLVNVLLLALVGIQILGCERR